MYCDLSYNLVPVNEVIGKEGLVHNGKLQLHFDGLSCGQRYLPAMAESVVESVER